MSKEIKKRCVRVHEISKTEADRAESGSKLMEIERRRQKSIAKYRKNIQKYRKRPQKSLKKLIKKELNGLTRQGTIHCREALRSTRELILLGHSVQNSETLVYILNKQ